MITAQIIPADALYDDVIQAAIRANMFVISNGKRTVISPIVPPGWVKLAVKAIDRHRAILEAPKCAAA